MKSVECRSRHDPEELNLDNSRYAPARPDVTRMRALGIVISMYRRIAFCRTKVKQSYVVDAYTIFLGMSINGYARTMLSRVRTTVCKGIISTSFKVVIRIITFKKHFVHGKKSSKSFFFRSSHHRHFHSQSFQSQPNIPSCSSPSFPSLFLLALPLSHLLRSDEQTLLLTTTRSRN